MQKIKNIFKRFLNKDGIVYKSLSKIYHTLSTFKYNVTNNKKIKAEREAFSKRANEAIEEVSKFNKADYVVFYNPTWLGVAASTKGLFKNYIGLEHVYKSSDIKNIAKAINDNEIKSVIFSQVCDGWIEIIEEIKKINNDISIKVIWHGNCYEFFSDFTWGLNKQVMNLYHEKKIDAFGFVRSTMYEFYKKVGFKSFYLQNNVFKENAGKTSKVKNKKVKIGIYNADSRELKNIYTALSAMKLVPNSMADIVPINAGATKFAELIDLPFDSINDYIPNDELMERIHGNDINIYPTFTENAPMFPLESFEMGVPCLLGNNNDYFVGTKLGEYVILEREDDPVYIKEKIMVALEHRDEIMKLYRDWKKDFDKMCSGLVDEFIK